METPEERERPQFSPLSPRPYPAAVERVLNSALASRSGFGALRHYEEIFRDTARLAWESGLLRSPMPWLAGPHRRFFDEWWYMLRRGASTRFLFRDLLADPATYEPRALWALFWALAHAEHDFLYLFTPCWSNEERLTGHLVSQAVMQLDNFGPSWRELAGISDSEPLCRITYIDTSTANQEQYTGGDIGLVVHGRYSPNFEFFKAAVLQAKKADWCCSCRIDVKQAERLLQREGLGFYLLYHPYSSARWSPAPTVHSVHGIESKIKEAIESKQETLKNSMAGRGWDFAAFVTFGLADPAAELGVLATSAAQVAHTVMTGSAVPPSRVLVITLGHGAQSIDWGGPNAFGEWISRAGKDEPID